jgi:hypothetical protein
VLNHLLERWTDSLPWCKNGLQPDAADHFGSILGAGGFRLYSKSIACSCWTDSFGYRSSCWGGLQDWWWLMCGGRWSSCCNLELSGWRSGSWLGILPDGYVRFWAGIRKVVFGALGGDVQGWAQLVLGVRGMRGWSFLVYDGRCCVGCVWTGCWCWGGKGVLLLPVLLGRIAALQGGGRLSFVCFRLGLLR